MSKLDDLCDEYGCTEDEMLEDFGNDSTIPGICMNEGCSATYEYEPDCHDGWCDACETNTVSSLFVLMGVI